MQVAHRSELGYVRTRNEDAALIHPLPDGGFLVGVADGMGGHPAGDVASGLAVQTIEAATESTIADPERWLVDALQAAHEAVLAGAAAEPAYAGMGTTAVLAYVSSDRAHLAHVGDSRAYLVRGADAAQLTHDHNRHGYLLQAIGIGGSIAPESVAVSFQAGDRLLLCTDGLSGLVDAPLIGALAANGSVDDACERLVDAALGAGGYDNVTVVLVEI